MCLCCRYYLNTTMINLCRFQGYTLGDTRVVPLVILKIQAILLQLICFIYFLVGNYSFPIVLCLYTRNFYFVC